MDYTVQELLQAIARFEDLTVGVCGIRFCDNCTHVSNTVVRCDDCGAARCEICLEKSGVSSCDNCAHVSDTVVRCDDCGATHCEICREKGE